MNSRSKQLYQIMQGCLQQHRDSQKALYDLFYAPAMGICTRYAHQGEDAKEIVQDGFLKIFRNLKDFSKPDDMESLYPAFRGWVKKIMVYTSIDHYRSHKNVQSMTDLDSQSYRLTSGKNHPLDKVSYEELIGMVQRLSPAYRTVFNLFVIDGYGHDEIAQLLHISSGTSKSNLAKARANLRVMLKKTHEEVYARYA